MQPISAPTPPPFDPDQAHARFGRLLGAVYRKWRRSVDLHFKEMGLSDASRAPLLALYDRGEAMRQKDLAEILSLEKSSLVRVLTQLRQMGLVEWEVEESDRRAKAICLTRQGQARVEQLLAKSMEIEHSILAGLSADELRVTRQTLEKIARRFDALKGRDA
ncbi:Transcriptional regulator SlyA [Pigmentiphaga humi]|uniref:Transcriptional regulator SlyA n=1 Tax=Pigmentiphaga humi TaxID=2478468 RepID=A0A3P4B8C2_9BURK|nr:MarR family transcriptional regulator [Pigmentiphaga humi]VCU71870.1 Transcriptional regulator SlyA [Pigmentiphaga humi]